MSNDTNASAPLSLDALFNAETAGQEPAAAEEQTEQTEQTERAEPLAVPHSSPGSPEDFASPASSDSPEDPEDVEHEDEDDDVERDVPEADPEDDSGDDADEGDTQTVEDDVDGHAPFLDSGDDADEPGETETTFADLGLPADLLKAVTDMGFVTPTAIQKEAIPVLLAGRDVVGVAQTGTGKTAAFGLPLLDAVDAREGVVQALVLAPTRELALQSADAITDMAHRSRGLEVVAVYGDRKSTRLNSSHLR